MVDAKGAGDDATLGGLPEHFGEVHHRHGGGRDDVGQHLAGTDRRKLVDVADDQESGPVRYCLHERLHQHDVDHAGFVNHQQITVERVVVAAFKAPTFGSTSSSRWIVLASKPGALFNTGHLCLVVLAAFSAAFISLWQALGIGRPRLFSRSRYSYGRGAQVFRSSRPAR